MIQMLLHCVVSFACAGSARTVFSMALAAGLLAACGGGGGSATDGGPAPGPGHAAQGRIEWPAAASAPALQVQSAAGSARVTAGGQFQVPVASAAPQHIDVVDDAGRLVLIGRAANGQAEASPATTAEALMFFALGAYTLPAQHHARAQELIRAHPALQAVVSRLAERLAGNPTLLHDGDAQVQQAVQDARQAMLATPAPAGQGAVHERPPSALRATAAAATARERPQAGETDLVLIEPGADTPQSGLLLLQAAGGGVMAQNSLRRAARLYAYQTGYMKDDGSDEIYTAPRLQGAPVEVPATHQLNLFNAVTDPFRGETGTSPWAPSTSASLALPQVAGSRRTYYDLVAIGPTMIAGATPLVWSDPLYAGQVATWDGTLEDLAYASLWGDLVGPAAGFLMFGSAAAIGPTQMAGFAGRFKALAKPLLGARGLTVARGGYAAVFATEVLGGIDAGTFPLDEVTQWFYDQAKAADPALAVDLQQSRARLQRLTRAAAVVAAVDAAMVALDLGAVIKDLQTARSAERWKATVTNARVNLSPAVPMVSRASTGVLITASVAGAPNGRFVYRWSTSHQRGNLFGVGVEGPQYDSTDKTTQYIVDIAALIDGALDTVSVEVFDDDGSGTIKPGQPAVGQASITILGQSGVVLTPSQVELLEGAPATFTASPPPGVAGPFTYLWTSTRNAGRVIGGTRFENTTGRAFYNADNAASGEDTITVEVFTGPATARVRVGAASATVRVARYCVGRVPDGQLTASYTFAGSAAGTGVASVGNDIPLGRLTIYLNDQRIHTGPHTRELYYCSGFRNFAGAPGDRLRIVATAGPGVNNWVGTIYLARSPLVVNNVEVLPALVVPLETQVTSLASCAAAPCPADAVFDRTYTLP